MLNRGKIMPLAAATSVPRTKIGISGLFRRATRNSETSSDGGFCVVFLMGFSSASGFMRLVGSGAENERWLLCSVPNGRRLMDPLPESSFGVSGSFGPVSSVMALTACNLMS